MSEGQSGEGGMVGGAVSGGEREVRGAAFWEDVHYGPDGLAPVVVQSVRDGRVLMVAWANAEALRRTARERRAWFWTRSRGSLWRKGDTSGNAMDVVRVAWDCDADTVLYLVEPHGPACHTGQMTCFYRGEAAGALWADGADALGGAEGQGARPAGLESGGAGMAWAGADTEAESESAGASMAGGAGGTALGTALAGLAAVIAQRERERPAGSYVAGLLAAGPLRALQKMGEEAVEAAIAGAAGAEPGVLRGEFADLWFHALVAMQALGVAPSTVAAELVRRHGLRPPR